jgi:ribosomal protein L7Ae-like RNA K-turn-binding protein
MAQQSKSVGFSGSYDPGDITFLLQDVALEATSIADKEKAIQSGTRHYSEMISEEKAPSAAYKSIFAKAMDAGAKRLGADIASLALALDRLIDGPITLASLVRAGAPAGVLLNRALKSLGRDVEHFGISIIRDKGLDDVAMRHILDTRPIEGLVFVDGWTGKGAISSQLEESFKAYSKDAPRLVVVADPCGRAWLAASGDDWLIPSGILGSTVSGLISRTILNDNIKASGGFHGCKTWPHLADHDITQSFVDEVWSWTQDFIRLGDAAEWSQSDRDYHWEKSQKAVQFIADLYGVTNFNRIKPGIAEATRAILRRMPQVVYISSVDDPDLQAMVHLLKEKEIAFEVAPDKIAPYRAITLIEKVS